eukprot:23525-Chlamydomonas_euryale.AAC.5
MPGDAHQFASSTSTVALITNVHGYECTTVEISTGLVCRLKVYESSTALTAMLVVRGGQSREYICLHLPPPADQHCWQPPTSDRAKGPPATT